MKKSRTRLIELDWIRGFACLAVIVMHSIDSNNYSAWLPEIEKLALFATPVFVLLAAFLLFYAYPDAIPANFLRRRLKYIVIPYILWSFLYTAYPVVQGKPFPHWHEFITNVLLGKFHIYFILIIVQFYLLFMLLSKWKITKQAVQMPVLIVGFAANLAYLYYFTSGSIPSIKWVAALQGRHYFMLLPAWIFYFLLGGFIARNYDKMKVLVMKYRYPLLMIALLGASIVVTMDGRITSKRPEVLLYTVSIIPFLFLLAFRFGQSSKGIQRLSPYSFGIYLSHPLFFRIFQEYFSTVPWLYFAQSFFVQLAGAWALTWAIQQLPLGFVLSGQGKHRKKSNYEQPTGPKTIQHL